MDTERIQFRNAGHFVEIYYSISEKMPRRSTDDEISQGDCPEFQAASYPGKFSRNNKGGSKLSRAEYKEEQVREWVAHFDDNPKYDNTSLAHKVRYLIQHLALLKVKSKEARAILVKVESESEKELLPEEANVRDQGEEQVNEEEDDQEEEEEEDDQKEEQEEGGGLGEEEVMDFVEAGERVSEDEMTEEEEMETHQERESRALREFEIGKYLDKTDQELFLSSDIVIPELVERSVGYNQRKENFINTYIEQEDFQDSQEILEVLSQAPAVVKGALKEKLQHLTNQEKATRLVMKSLSDTIKRLKETPGKAARQQVQIILAATSHHK